jgi:hypothetical protein
MSVDCLTTNPRRATMAATAGAVVGALGVTIVVLLLATVATGVVSAADLTVAILIFIVALIGWSLGLFLFGLPLWWLFHRNGWRGRRVAMLLGAATTYVIVFLLEISGGIFAVATGDSDGGHLTSLVWAGLMALLGAIVALVIWRVAYRQSQSRV